MQAVDFQSKIFAWFDQNGRKDLPWQQDLNPYAVWISEIMLQQTQVTSVILYYNKFMASFPSIDILAEATLDEVLLHWAGLGYYARARNLHKTAKIIYELGRFPNTLETLTALPGIGRSTAGAILSIAFKQPAAILDGNVKRVLARYHAVSGWPGDPKVEKKLWQISMSYTPAHRTADYTQAMMDLGATVCKKNNPDCMNCPIQSSCLACLDNKVALFPTSKPKKTLPIKQRYFLIAISQQNEILLQQRPALGIWGGLWSLPECLNLQDIDSWSLVQGLKVSNQEILATQRHTFSHFHLDYTPLLIKVERTPHVVFEINDHEWYRASELNNLALPTPIDRLLRECFKQDD
jgi:A/G-specific adenine glycosylase